MARPEWVTIAVLTRVRGNRGELAAVPYSNPERFDNLDRVFLFAGNDPAREAKVESAWFHDRELILKFSGVDSISDAEALKGAEVRLPGTERRTPEPDEYFESDLVGCEVVDSSGQILGQVTAWEEGGGAGLLRVGELLIPFAKSICKQVDVENKRIVVDLPDGLKDLNA